MTQPDSQEGESPVGREAAAPRWTENPTALPPAHGAQRAPGPTGTAARPQQLLMRLRAACTHRPRRPHRGGRSDRAPAWPRPAQPGRPTGPRSFRLSPDPRGDRQVSTHSWRSRPPQGGPHHGHRAVSSTWAGRPLGVHTQPLPQAGSGGGGTAAGKAGPAPPPILSPRAGGREGRHQP